MAIQELLHQHFLQNKRIENEHRDTIYVTQLSADRIDSSTGVKKSIGCCKRAAYYSCIGLGEKTKCTERSLVRKLGDYTESMLIHQFKDANILVEKAKRIKLDDYGIVGRIDCVLNIEDKNIGVEIKSLSSNKYINNSIYGCKWEQPFPKYDHLLQCMMYLYAERQSIDNFILLYIRRDNCNVKEFNITLAAIDGVLYPAVDGNIIYSINCNNILENALYLKGCIKDDIVPSQSYDILYSKQRIDDLYKSKFISKYLYEKYAESPFGDQECVNCDFLDICIRDGGK